jgi:hypothetical protein
MDEEDGSQGWDLSRTESVMSQNDFMSQNDDDEWDFEDGPSQQPQPQQQQQQCSATPLQQAAPAIVPPPAGQSHSIHLLRLFLRQPVSPIQSIDATLDAALILFDVQDRNPPKLPLPSPFPSIFHNRRPMFGQM